ncbi:MAG: hypothetical protein ABIA97_04630 [Candidatus Omnitrophota bacterium]
MKILQAIQIVKSIIERFKGANAEIDSSESGEGESQLAPFLKIKQSNFIVF